MVVALGGRRRALVFRKSQAAEIFLVEDRGGVGGGAVQQNNWDILQKFSDSLSKRLLVEPTQPPLVVMPTRPSLRTPSWDQIPITSGKNLPFSHLINSTTLKQRDREIIYL